MTSTSLYYKIYLLYYYKTLKYDRALSGVSWQAWQAEKASVLVSPEKPVLSSEGKSDYVLKANYIWHRAHTSWGKGDPMV